MEDIVSEIRSKVLVNTGLFNPLGLVRELFHEFTRQSMGVPFLGTPGTNGLSTPLTGSSLLYVYY